MIGKNIVGSRPATLVEVSEIMEKRLEEAEAEMKRLKKLKKPVPVPPPSPVSAQMPAEGEGAEGAPEGTSEGVPAAAPKPEEKSPLGLEQRYTLEYAKKFAKLGKKKAEELYEKLMKFEKMKPEAATKLIDLMPVSAEQIKLVLAKERVPAGDKDLGELLKPIEEFRK